MQNEKKEAGPNLQNIWVTDWDTGYSVQKGLQQYVVELFQLDINTGDSQFNEFFTQQENVL